MKTRNVLLLFILFTCGSRFGYSQELKMYTNWDEAQSSAQKEDKEILIILTGSEWCAPCKKMDKNVISNIEFINFAKNNLILFIVDLPGGAINLDSKVFKDFTYFENKYKTKAIPSLILTNKNGIKIKNLKGRLFKLKNVMKQLQSL